MQEDLSFSRVTCTGWGEKHREHQWPGHQSTRCPGEEGRKERLRFHGLLEGNPVAGEQRPPNSCLLRSPSEHLGSAPLAWALRQQSALTRGWAPHAGGWGALSPRGGKWHDARLTSLGFCPTERRAPSKWRGPPRVYFPWIFFLKTCTAERARHTRFPAVCYAHASQNVVGPGTSRGGITWELGQATEC